MTNVLKGNVDESPDLRPTGERRENTGITFLVADTMPIALGCQKAVRTAAFLPSTLRCKLQSQSIFFVLCSRIESRYLVHTIHPYGCDSKHFIVNKLHF